MHANSVHSLTIERLLIEVITNAYLEEHWGGWFAPRPQIIEFHTRHTDAHRQARTYM
jgi:hypothetical protein